VRIKACPQLLPKTATLYPETGNFVAENFLATKLPVSVYKVAVFGNKCGQALRKRSSASPCGQSGKDVAPQHAVLARPPHGFRALISCVRDSG